MGSLPSFFTERKYLSPYEGTLNFKHLFTFTFSANI